MTSTNSRRHMRRTALTALGTAAVLAVVAPAAYAAVQGVASAGTTTTTGTWGAAGGAIGGAPAKTDYVANFVNGAGFPVYFAVYSTGTVALTGQSYLAVNSKPSGNAPPEIALDACVGASWNQLLGTCAGTVVRLTSSNSAVALSATLAIPVGANVQIKAAPIRLPNFPQAFQTTVTISVGRSQAAVTTTSS